MRVGDGMQRLDEQLRPKALSAPRAFNDIRQARPPAMAEHALPLQLRVSTRRIGRQAFAPAPFGDCPGASGRDTRADGAPMAVHDDGCQGRPPMPRDALHPNARQGPERERPGKARSTPPAGRKLEALEGDPGVSRAVRTPLPLAYVAGDRAPDVAILAAPFQLREHVHVRRRDAPATEPTRKLLEGFQPVPNDASAVRTPRGVR